MTNSMTNLQPDPQTVVDPATVKPAIRQVVVDISRMTIGDIALLDEFRELARQRRSGKDVQMPIGRLIGFMDRIVEGGVADIPATQFSAVMDSVSEAINQMMTRVNGGEDDDEKN